MGNLRPVLIMGLVFLGYMIWVEWQKDYGPAPQTPAPVTESALESAQLPDVPAYNSETGAAADLPQAQTAPGVPTTATQVKDPFAGRSLIEVSTDVLDVKIDPEGGTVVSAVLKDYPVKLEQPDVKVELLQTTGEHVFIAQSGLLSQQEAPNHTSEYRVEQWQYGLSEGAGELRVPLVWTSPSGIEVKKEFVFSAGSYDVQVLHRLANRSSAGWAGSSYEQLQRTVPDNEDDGGFTNPWLTN